MITVEVADGLTVSIREAIQADEAFIFNSWLVSFRENGDWPCRVSKGRYFGEQKAVIAKLLKTSRVLVACNPDRPSQILGYIVAEGPLLHWVYVKDVVRTRGIGALLVAESSPLRAASHWTVSMADYGPTLCADVHYDPFALRNC